MAILHALVVLAISTWGFGATTQNTTCTETITYSCNETDSNGMCVNTTETVIFGKLVNIDTFVENGTDFLQNGTVIEKQTFLQPRNGTNCWGVCCTNPCDAPSPCLNSGTCTKLEVGSKTFKCECKPGFGGDWCQEVKKCGDDKTCDVHADCKNGECHCRSGYQGGGKYCTAACTEMQFKTSEGGGCEDVKEPLLNFSKGVEDQRQYSIQTCPGEPVKRSIGWVDCKTVDGVTKFVMSTFQCLTCNVTLNNVFKPKEEEKNMTIKEMAKYVNALQILTQPPNKTAQNVISVVDSLIVLAETLKTKEREQIDVKTMKDVMLIVQHTGNELPSQVDTDASSGLTKDNLEPTVPPTSKEKVVRNATRTTGGVLDDFARAVKLPDTGPKEVEIVTKKITLKIVEPPSNKTDSLVFDPEAFVPAAAELAQSAVKTKAETSMAKKSTVKMSISADTLKEMRRKAGNNQNMRVVFILYQDASLLTVDKRTGKVVHASYKSGDSAERSPNIGKKFTIEFKDAQKSTPEQKKQLEKTRSVLKETYFCVFWDYLAEDWATEGCEFKNSSGNYFCECEHFTSFALLLRVTKVLTDYAPDYYSYFACSLSVVCLLITMVIYLGIRDLRVRRPTPIMVNICLNLMIGYLFFVIGMDGKNKDFSDAACYASAIIMHISFLSSWFWMLIYSLNMYYALVKVVGASPLVGKKAFMYAFGYGVPVLIVAIDLIVSIEMDKIPATPNDSDFEKSYIATHICWVRHLSMYIGFATPVGVILFVNIVLFFVILRKLTWKRREIQSSKEKANFTQQVFMAITMMSMMGLTWIFGYMMLIWDDPTYQKVLDVLFNIFNTGQGIVIFLMSCVRQEAVRILWVRPIEKCFGCDTRKKAKGKKFNNSESSSNVTHTGTTGISTLPRLSKDVTSTTAL